MKAILRELDRLYPAADCELNRKNPFELLCATILSAQCTDERVNMVTPALFARFPTPAALAAAPAPVLEDMIRSTGFFRNKAKNLLGAARLLSEKWAGEVPRSMDELLELPGVARKTANIVVSNAYGKVEGIAVDTHVFRLSHRLGLTEEHDPDKVERDLCALLPKDQWFHVNYRFIDHGRAVCTAKRPACGACALSDICPSAFQVPNWRQEL